VLCGCFFWALPYIARAMDGEGDPYSALLVSYTKLRIKRIPSSTSFIVEGRTRQTFSIKQSLSRVTICEIFTTESLLNSDSSLGNNTFPGATDKRIFVVNATQTMVAIRLSLKLSD